MAVIDPVIYFTPNVTQFYDMNGLTAAFRETSINNNNDHVKSPLYHHYLGGGRRKGRCKWFNVAKGWGFLTPDDGTQDVFVHQSVIHKAGFRSLDDGEECEFESIPSDKGVEATYVSGPSGAECRGSNRRPMSRKKFRKIRCYNCGDFGNHIAAKCPYGPLPKRCHNCKSTEHLIADCPLRDPQDKKPGDGRYGNGMGGGDFQGQGQGAMGHM